MTKTFNARTAEPMAALTAYLSTASGALDASLIETLASRIRQIEIDVPSTHLGALDVAGKFAGSQQLTATDIAALNRLMPWSTAILFGGQLQGGVWNEKKRNHIHTVPDPHLEALAEHLQGKCVLEVGCHEGYYTLGMALFASRIIAVDGRIDNVVKTLVRSWMAGVLDRVVPICHDFESPQMPAFLPVAEDGFSFDIIHHNGVLYHLSDPLAHLKQLLQANPARMLFLDTHVAMEHQLNARYQFDGASYAVHAYREPVERGYAPFAGMTPVAVWLRHDDLINFLRAQGFHQLIVNDARQERNGARVRILVSR